MRKLALIATPAGAHESQASFQSTGMVALTGIKQKRISAKTLQPQVITTDKRKGKLKKQENHENYSSESNMLFFATNYVQA